MTSWNADNEGLPSPLATPDQDYVERLACRLRQDRRVQAAMERVKSHWVDEMKPNAEHMSRYSAEYEQAAFCGLINAVNDDPLYPRLHAFGRLAHMIDGEAVPATKSGHPNPDYIYRFAPIDGVSHCSIEGQMPVGRPIAFEVSMLTAAQAYQKNVSLSQIRTDEDGHFTITVDPEPAGERLNHFQSDAETIQMLIRDVISDAATQSPVTLRLTRLGPSPERDPRSIEDMVEQVERHIRKHVDDLIFVTRNFVCSSEPNSFPAPEIRQESMYSVAQAYSPGNFKVADDEALLVRLTLGSARYAVVPVSDFWGGVGHILEKPVTLGTGRARPDRDGAYTFVLAHRDPGIANWIDPDGLHEGAMFIRWIGFDGTNKPEVPELKVELMRFDDLESRLPDTVPRFTPEERAKTQAHWRGHYARVMG